ncbi:type I restriction enzyme, S subunit [Soonwooa buanensis]|uniref:Type I restriction enzyme, S subunit n=1 Tax=Soonwooa buanensis TaxID=619805 RepID=A0A1T5CYY4_9FLAO|nr:restriction endonuclease subunit S [Soonwooa buanensis]SKB64577.1 type I restriction enzyme, S subunit [Soonwooa buanensis]
MSYKKLGEYIQQVNNRNRDLEVETLLGVSITKKLIPSIANTVGTDMSAYKIIERGQFAYGTITSRNGDKISIALLDEFEKALVSQIYIVFEVIDTSVLLPEYLMMWFSRPEFDRYARYHSHGSTRESFDWTDMCEVELPIPSIEKQREMVAQYGAVANKIKVNEAICEKLEATAQALYKQWFVDFEFPNDEGQPYKFSGGAMVFNEELEKEIPEGWEVGKLEDYVKINRGASPRPIENFITNNDDDMPWVKISDATAQKTDFLLDTKLFIDKYGVRKSRVVEIGDLILSNSASPGLPKIMNIKACVHDGWLIFNDYKKIDKYFLIEYLKFNKQGILSEGNGSVFKNLKTEILKDYQIILNENCVNSFSFLISNIYELLQSNSIKLKKLTQLQSLMLSRLATLEG